MIGLVNCVGYLLYISLYYIYFLKYVRNYLYFGTVLSKGSSLEKQRNVFYVSKVNYYVGKYLN